MAERASYCSIGGYRKFALTVRPRLGMLTAGRAGEPHGGLGMWSPSPMARQAVRPDKGPDSFLVRSPTAASFRHGTSEP